MSPTGPRDLSAQRRLVQLEGTIQGGLDSFIAVGEALTEIRDSRLYRFVHATFEDYAKARWGLSRSRSYELMDAVAVSAIADIDNSSQARELAPVLRDEGPEAVREVWAETVARTEGKPTAAVVREVVTERRELPDIRTPAEKHVSTYERLRTAIREVGSLLDQVDLSTDERAAVALLLEGCRRRIGGSVALEAIG